MARIGMDAKDFERLKQAIFNFSGDAETVINDILHNQAGELILNEVKNLMPVSNRDWKGKKTQAKSAKSLMIKSDENLSVTVKTMKNYQYLYFPDDGTSTRNHVGNQEFFLHGAELQREEITNRCINGLINKFEGAVN